MNQQELVSKTVQKIAVDYEMKIQKFRQLHYYQGEASNHGSASKQQNAKIWSQVTNKLI